MIKVMTVPLFPESSPARGQGSFVGRGRDFHGKAPLSCFKQFDDGV